MISSESVTPSILDEALSAAERLIVLCGVTVHERRVIALAIKELVARDYLSPAQLKTKRVVLDRNQELILVPGPRSAPSGNPVLDSVFNLIRHAAPPSELSPTEKTNAWQQEIRLAIKETFDGFNPEGIAASFRTIQQTFRERTTYLFPTLQNEMYPSGLVGVSVEALTTAVLQKRATSSGWSWVGHNYVRTVVLPSLVAREYSAYKERGMARWTHRNFYEYRRRLTDKGLIERQRLEDRLGLRTPFFRVRACNHALDHALIASAQNATGMEMTFRAIEKGVNNAWLDRYGD